MKEGKRHDSLREKKSRARKEKRARQKHSDSDYFDEIEQEVEAYERDKNKERKYAPGISVSKVLID